MHMPQPALDCLKVLLEEGRADANSRETNGDTPLHYLC
jgi:ankyrin repeat protein